MQFHFKRQFIIYLVVGIVIFLSGRVNSPMVGFDPEFLILKKVESKLTSLKLEISQMSLSNKEIFAIEDKFKDVSEDIGSALVHARKRFYSTIVTDLTAIFVVLTGGIISILRSWRKDVSLLKAQT